MKLIADLKKYREILIDLAKRDVKNKYLGSYLGFFWAFLQPLFSLVILWGVFSFGLKIKTDSKVSFFLWLMTGLIPWNFLSEGIVSSANSILENSFLVKKIVFRISLLPIVKVLSSSLVHCFFIFILFLSFLASGYELDIYCLQVFYYFFCGTTFIFVLSWISSSVIIFFKDIGQIISLSLQFLYWLTPILWSYTVLPEKFKIFLILNPFFYIVEGYRDALIHKVWFWERGYESLAFFVLNLIIGLFGFFIFRKLKPHFADVI